MNLVGLDLNSGRARAVAGPSARSLALVRLDGSLVDLPLAIALDERAPRVGGAGFALMRARPHLVCADFLAHLGGKRVWSSDRHRLDADQALALVFAALAGTLQHTSGVVLALPAYLDGGQMARVVRLAEAAKIPVLGSLCSSIAAVLASPLVTEQAAEPGLMLVVDSDSHALSWSIVERRPDSGGGQLCSRLTQQSASLGRAAWLRRLLDGVAGRCVRQSRRDPRESAGTEQALYEQLVSALDQGQAKMTQLRVQGEGWYHHLMLQADEMAALVAPLLRLSEVDLDAILNTVDSLGRLCGVIVTAQAASLPGLLEVVQARFRALPAVQVPADDSADYGDAIVAQQPVSEMVHVLPAEATACVAHELAVRIHSGDFPRGHLDVVALPGAEAGSQSERASGPARLTFRGQEHLLPASTFSLGRDPSCDLVFESALYPHVSGRHCEIVFDRRAYVLCDRSRHGTLLNDRPIQQQAALHSGDWIRLGPSGPVLRFLGESATTNRQGPAPRAASNW